VRDELPALRAVHERPVAELEALDRGELGQELGLGLARAIGALQLECLLTPA
jgi:hypothetical protein